MDKFLKTTHLSEILEESHKHPVVIFKYSNECGSSTRLANQLEQAKEEKTIDSPIYIVIVQIHKALSQKVEELFDIKHESPQIITVEKGKVLYTAHHGNIHLSGIIASIQPHEAL